MDRNAFLAFALSFAVLTAWMIYSGPGAKPRGASEPAQAEAQRAPEPAEKPVESAEAPALPEPPRAEGEVPTPSAQPGVADSGEVVEIDTPLVRAELDSIGGVLRHLELKGFRVAPSPDSPPLALTTGRGAFANALASPFRELGIGDLSRVDFEVERSEGDRVEFRYASGGISVRKSYDFDPESYAFELRVAVENHSDRPIGPRYGLSWPAEVTPGIDFREQSLATLHDGSVTLQPLADFGRRGFFGGAPTTERPFAKQVDWAGVTTTYFVSAMLPEEPAEASAHFVAVEPTRIGVVQLFFDPVTLPPGQGVERIFRVYVGPKEADRLEAVGGGLVRAINLGWVWLSPLTLAFGWLLHALHSIIPNFGVGIILLTIFVRAATTPLTMRQMKSMERMRALQPKLNELKEKYPDDRQKQSEEMMALYRREGVNPLGGCLPMVLQLPVFIGLYYALQSSIDLRQAPFVGWINDLSAPDQLFMIPGLNLPFRVLPLVMGATMVVQQRITPMQADPAQARMMMVVMPVMMTVLFYQFPSGLVLYWMVSNLLAIGHQLWVGRQLRATA
ncbi:MAG TPA: membrane protein insertase YidC [Myxococcota bacterium]|nr:membrane protein insertase YidC [Myxococcota bacterium]